MHFKRRHPSAAKAAFTLIELLTVIAIIGILAAIIIPTVGSVRSSARAAQAVSNIKQIGMGTLLYAQENRGAILGQGDESGTGFKYFELTMRQWATYLGRSPAGNIERVNAVIGQVRDPLVPDEPAFLRSGYKTTWALNRIFNVQKGYQAQGLATSQDSDRFRNLAEFTDPSRTIYALSGGYEFGAPAILNADLMIPPTRPQQIYYMHRKGRATPVLFLDGSARLMDYPIDGKLTKLREFN
ncbi:MAG: prepilin-type N-terminal cleavage/methylation domain-containing protein [Opitutaceae bacterium]|jgi:prepilin-type N-terminal cleavage/methylation domain-containing protein|nr:prepilin-type N-terminal cleavage/methylation domain-containing protein [Opitutaceae bacterium]